MTDEINAAPVTQSRELALLQTWFSPSFPIGSFAFSQGLESAVEAGMVRGEDTLLAWIADLFEFGSIQNDLILMASAWKATDAGRWADLLETAEFASALQPSAERHFEASVQGKSFLEAICAAWPSNGFAKALEACRDVPVVYANGRRAILAIEKGAPGDRAFADAFAAWGE